MTDATAPRLDTPSLPTKEALRALFEQHADYLAQSLALESPRVLADFVQAAIEAQPDWLGAVDLPEPEGGVISLPHRQLRTLRAQLAAQASVVSYLHQTAEQNAAMDRKMHEFTCALLTTARGDADALCALLRSHFSIDVTTLHTWRSLDPSAQHALQGWKASGTPLCGRLSDPQRSALLGAEFPHTGSAAVVAVPGALADDLQVLAMGRFAPDGFTPAQGTLFLTQIGELASAFLRTA
ncbi:DUF484 family protein [Halothiobacillus sp. DCM-1]|uniref:DUF484 family protein n=1 Tax=Halothiobacillus sp. DCM-1 TaxID=3112558 RepID=UPI00324A35E4